MRKTLGAASLAFLLLSCDPLARTEIFLTFDDTGEKVNVDVVSEENHLRTYHAADGERLGEEVLAGRDEWSLRFANAHPDDERIVLNRAPRGLTRIEQQATINTADLQKFFFDAGVTVQVTHGEGWTELTMYPGTSTRATRKQIDTVHQELQTFASLAVAYFEALRPLYAYIDRKPGRAEEVFYGAFAGDKDEPAQLSDQEQDLVVAAKKAAEALWDAGQGEQEFPRLADLVYNPFPGAVAVSVPSQPLAVEGFTRLKNGSLSATTPTPADAVASLEGRWVTPDPLAVLSREDKSTPRQIAIELAAAPRQVAPVVTANEVAGAIVTAMQPQPRYRVRWMTGVSRTED